MRVAFLSHQRQWWRKQRLAAKYLKMRLEGVTYPDVYCLAQILADNFDFLLEDENVPAGKYDLILTELGASESQLRYVESLVAAGDPPVAVIPGPPAILSRDLTDAKMRMVKRILTGSRHVWAYSPELKIFCDGLIGCDRTVVIPWPYDFAATRQLGGNAKREAGRHKILVQAPMSFHDIVQNHPFVLKSVLLDVFQELPAELREKISFHTFIYNPTDAEKYESSEFAKELPCVREGKMGYRAFVRFLAGCDGVINLTAGNILGRITFLSAALGRPGIFSDNSQLNAELYPGSTVAMFDTVRLRELVGLMLRGLGGAAQSRLMPSVEVAAEVGDFATNRARLREIVASHI
ncbi:MAG: hypothetical protein WB729_02110 [Candidatus Sulfotelmatobacter sp.]